MRRRPGSSVEPELIVRSLAGSALYQDLGRGHRSAGVPGSGAFDPVAHAAATGLVGRPEGDATIEVVGRLVLRAPVRVTAAVVGGAEVRIVLPDGREWMQPTATCIEVPPGADLEISASRRAWIAVAGGMWPAAVLGSRSSCLLGPVGPPPLGVGDRIPLTSACGDGHVGDVLLGTAPASVTGAGSPVLRAVSGPHLELAPTFATVIEASRIGVRLSVDGVVESVPGLPSLGVVPGTIQVVPSGEWIVLGPDAGTMGGYPVIGVLVRADLRLLAHLSPGDRLGVVPVSLGGAGSRAPDPAPRFLRLGALVF